MTRSEAIALVLFRRRDRTTVAAVFSKIADPSDPLRQAAEAFLEAQSTFMRTLEEAGLYVDD